MILEMKSARRVPGRDRYFSVRRRRDTLRRRAFQKAGGKTSDEKALRAARRDDYYNGFNRHDYYPALPRQHSFEYYEGEGSQTSYTRRNFL